MAPMSSASLALFLALNLVLCNLAFSSYTYKPLSQCPPDTLKLDVCADVLNGLVHAQIGEIKNRPCCGLIGNLISLDAAACLCTAVHANIIGIVNLKVPIDLTLLVNKCGYELPAGFQCPPQA